MENLIMIGGGVVGLIIIFFAIGLTFSRLYKKASKELAFVRTGAGGSKVVKDGGAFVLPVLHDTIEVNMNTLKLEVRKKDNDALITFDRMRVDVSVEFYVRVKQDVEAINLAAQTLGNKTTNTSELKVLIEGKLVDVLRSVASSMTMKDLHEKRSNFVQNVQNGVSKDLEQNGLELESVSLTSFDQTRREFFNPDNVFDAEGLTLLTSEIEGRRKLRNEIEKDNQLSIEKKNLENQKETLLVKQEQSQIELETNKKISFQVEEQKAMVEKYKYEKNQEIEKARIDAERATEEMELARRRAVESAKVDADKEVQSNKIEAEKVLETKNIDRQRQIQEANIEKEKVIELTKQEKEIALAQKSEEKAAAEAKAKAAQAELVRVTEEVKTLEDVAAAERSKQVEVIRAKADAEKDSARIVVAAEAEKNATEAQAEAIVKRAQAEATATEAEANAKANALLINAKAQSEADKVAAEGIKIRMEAEAAGKEKIIEAQNKQSVEIIEMENRKLLIDKLPQIIAESSKHLNNIKNISIVDVNGLGGLGGNGGEGVNGSGQSLPDQVVNASLRHKAYSSLVEKVMVQSGLPKGSDLGGSLEEMVVGSNIVESAKVAPEAKPVAKK